MLAALFVLSVLFVLFVQLVLVFLMSPSFKHWGSLCRMQVGDPFVSRTCMPPGLFMCADDSCAPVMVRARRGCGGLARCAVLGCGVCGCCVLHARAVPCVRVPWASRARCVGSADGGEGFECLLEAMAGARRAGGGAMCVVEV